MSILETFLLALKNIRGNRMRTFLTMLGIIIGVTSVIVIVGLGNGMTKYMEESFGEMGINTLTVSITGRGSSRGISVEEMYSLVEENVTLLEDISPVVPMRGEIKIGTETLSATSATGVGESYLSMKNYEISQGRALQYLDVKERKAVCVVGSYVDQTYFGGKAVGQSLKVGSTKLTVVGVLAQKADEMEEGGTDDCLFLPYSAAARLSNTGAISSYTLTVTAEDLAAQAKEVVENRLYDVFEDSDAYTVTSMSELLDTMTSMLGVIVGVLVAIAGISLVVSGIGIMNIMLVSVTERTREIGIRKALGAKESVILRQFVIEAATTSALGGLIGIGLGYVLSMGATKLIEALMDTALVVTPSAGSVALAFGISAGIGILFGYLPARKAARLNPIDALRYD